MDITRYTFQSPYPNQIQIGRPDTTVKKEDDGGSKKESATPVVAKTPNEWMKSEATATKGLQQIVQSSQQLIDTYA